jgi:hypothetical protein
VATVRADSLHRPLIRGELDVGVHQRQEAIQVTLIEGFDRPTMQLYILLRNTRSPARQLRVFIRRG